MRTRFTVIIVALAMLALIAAPGLAQDEAPTIADIVVASATAEEAQFTVLLAAVQAADPIFLELLADPGVAYTVFAPTDAAFGALLEALDTSPEELLGNTALLNQVLAYHVVPGIFEAEAVVALDGSLLGTVLAGAALSISMSDGAVFVDDSQVIAVDVAAANGVVHVIDAVLLPEITDADMMEDAMMEPAGSIAELVIATASADAAEFTILLAAVEAVGPAVVELLSGPGPYTVFAPTDAAFADLLAALGVTAEELLGDTDLLATVLSYHVVPGKFAAEDVIAAASLDEMAGVNIATLLGGTTVNISLSDGGVMVNDSNVIDVDIMADNGVIHVIDAVLLPPME
jgi:transforming growth factor-beta-induced protein